MMVLPTLAHLTAWVVLTFLTMRLARNLRFLRRVRRITRLPDSPPRVSVLVPARNESASIAACIESLAHQAYPNYEIIALDDHSSDDTGAQLDALAEQSPHLTVLPTRNQGWIPEHLLRRLPHPAFVPGLNGSARGLTKRVHR